ncbi:hypothetical protein PENTCL1PPCAC_7830, partial [Pristionchus entomophagus]
DDEGEEKEEQEKDDEVPEEEQRAILVTSDPIADLEVRMNEEVEEKMEGEPRVADDESSLISPDSFCSRKSETGKDYEEEMIDEDRGEKEEEEVPEGEQRASIGSSTSIPNLGVRTNGRVEEKIEEDKKEYSSNSIAHLWIRRNEVDSDDEGEEMEEEEEEEKEEADMIEGDPDSSTSIADLNDGTNEKVEEKGELEPR